MFAIHERADDANGEVNNTRERQCSDRDRLVLFIRLVLQLSVDGEDVLLVGIGQHGDGKRADCAPGQLWRQDVCVDSLWFEVRVEAQHDEVADYEQGQRNEEDVADPSELGKLSLQADREQDDG